MTLFVSFRLLAEIFWKVYRYGFLWALRIVLKEIISFEQRSVLLMNFGFRARKVSDFWQKNGQECQTSVRLAQRNILKKTMLWRRKCFCLFQTLIEKRWEVARKTFSCVLSTENYLSRGLSFVTFSDVRWHILSDSDFQQRFFGEFIETAFFKRWG